jgi:OOP family OmpA-OmpF porin
MIKQLPKPVFTALAIATLGASANVAFAQTTDIVIKDMNRGPVPYVIDQRGVVARSGTGLCWRTGFWTPELAAKYSEAGCACDKDLLPKEVCEPPPPPKPAEPAPPPPPAPKPAAEKVTLAADFLFDFDKAVLKPEGQKALDDVVGKAQGMKLETIISVGYTDYIGSDKYNQKLSERRAEAVKSYMVSKGIEANRIYTEGKGEANPVTAGKCDTVKGPRNRTNKKLIECLQPDRRVQIEVIGTREPK